MIRHVHFSKMFMYLKKRALLTLCACVYLVLRHKCAGLMCNLVFNIDGFKINNENYNIKASTRAYVWMDLPGNCSRTAIAGHLVTGSPKV